jgi:hypothetical protein
MRCAYCHQEFHQGARVVQVFYYWTTPGEDGHHDMYRDGVKPEGWAHIDCVAD